MKKDLHLICNAHIDPVWQWEWEEGACETISTFRVAAKFCKEFDGFIFCHNEAILYQWIEEYEPSLFAEIQSLVKLGKWHIMGGWFLQPDCNMPSGEGFVRNILAGRQYFQEKFGVAPTTAINFDPFGQSRGLVQIMAKSGFDSYIFCRPFRSFCRLPSERFTWVGYDGSEIIGARVMEGYNTNRGNATEKIDKVVKNLSVGTDAPDLCLWGVGNHGGGPSHKDLMDITQKLSEWEEAGVRVVHSTPEAYFEALRASGAELPRHEGDINLWAPGCYTSQVKVKQKYRQLENELFACEKMCAALASSTDFPYPQKELSEALYDLMTIQFHDALPGSSIRPVEEMAIRMADHGLEILSRVRARAFFRLSRNEKSAKNGEIPIIAYNPHPYPVEGDFECEFVLADQNRTGTYFMPSVYQNEQKIPSQPEKETSNIPIDWRKKIVFHASLPPMQISRFDCKLEELSEKPPISSMGDDRYFFFDYGDMHIAINKHTGLIDSCVVSGKEYLSNNSLSIDVYKDDEDPWGMRIRGWKEKIGSFKLLSEKEGSDFSSLLNVCPSVRLIEDGEVRSVVEAVFGYASSRAVMRYKLSKLSPTVELEIRIVNADTKKMYKLFIPSAMQKINAFAEVAFGEEPFKQNGDENINQRYIRVEGSDERVLNVYNRGTYGSSVDKNTLMITLMRSPAYCAHPIDDKTILPQDRHSAFIEQGERIFELKLVFGKETVSNAIAAQVYNEKPTVLSFFPSGEGHVAVPSDLPAIALDGGKILLSAFKKAEKSGEYIVRLFNPQKTENQCLLRSSVFALNQTILFSPFEVKTFRITNGAMEECDMMEGS